MLNKIINLTRIKIFAAILLSVGMVKFISPVIFLADSPTVNPQFIASVQNLPGTIWESPGRFIAMLPKFNFDRSSGQATNNSGSQAGSRQTEVEYGQIAQVTPQPYMIFEPLTKGVSAAETENGKKILKIESGTKYTMQTETVNGREVQVIEIVQ